MLVGIGTANVLVDAFAVGQLMDWNRLTHHFAFLVLSCNKVGWSISLIKLNPFLSTSTGKGLVESRPFCLDPAIGGISSNRALCYEAIPYMVAW